MRAHLGRHKTGSDHASQYHCVCSYGRLDRRLCSTRCRRGPAAAQSPSLGRAAGSVFYLDRIYIGAHVGRRWARGVTNTLAGARLVDDWQHNINGYLGGLQVGANYQFADRWVIGVEGQFSWAYLDGKNHCAITGRDLNCSTKSDWLSTAALRFGFTRGEGLLAYIKGGAAWVSDEYAFNEFDPNRSISASSTRWGWMVGTGIEYAVTSNWSAKIKSLSRLRNGNDPVPRLGPGPLNPKFERRGVDPSAHPFDQSRRELSV